jgi:hypothetical protein
VHIGLIEQGYNTAGHAVRGTTAGETLGAGLPTYQFSTVGVLSADQFQTVAAQFPLFSDGIAILTHKER